MAYRDLSDFIRALEKEGELVRVKAEVDPILEITEIADRQMKSPGGGKALLFENVKGSPVPVIINAFGSTRRMNLALEVDRIEDVGDEILAFIEPELPKTLVAKIKMLPRLKQLADFIPKTVKTGPCKDVIETTAPSLDPLPVLQCWPEDAGRFITFPLVFTRNPRTGRRNCGMYRMQVYDSRTTGMHWQIHKHGAKHYQDSERAGRRIDVAVAIGTDPAVTFAAMAPMPDDVDEMMFAGFLRKEPVEMVKCETVDLEVPANSEIVLEGYCDPEERRIEGPFGDHTGYYSLADSYPVFHVTAVTRRKNPIYSTTIVGRPPMEDYYMGKAVERIFLPLVKKTIPEIVDMAFPAEGVFHNMVFIAIDKRYPGHARKVMSSIWGTGQMMFTKLIVVVDKDVNVHDTSAVLFRIGNNVDWKRDTMIVEGPVDALDHAAPLANLGGKMGIDATRKGPDEGHARPWPADIVMTPEIKAIVDGRWGEYGIS